MSSQAVYYDKNGTQIKAGMFIKHDDEDKAEKVYASDDNDLGINASNEAWLERHGRNRELYPLYQFNLKEWVIVK